MGKIVDLPSDLTTILVVLLFLAGFALVALLIHRGESNRDTRFKMVLNSLGFFEVSLPASHMQEQLERIYRHKPTQRFELRHLYEKAGQRGNYYFYELVELSRVENTWLGANSIAVYSPDLQLPHAHIMGRILDGKSAGWIQSMTEKMVGWAAIQSGFIRLQLSDYPDIDQKLIVMVEDEADARVSLYPERLRRLTWLADDQKLSGILCAGNTFIIERQVAPRKSNLENDYTALAHDAASAWNALSLAD